MRAFLCGGGSGTQVKTAYAKLSEIIDKDKPLLYIPIAMDFDKMDSCYEWIIEELKDYSITNIEMVKSFKELDEKNLDDYSCVFIGGGNTYKLLFELKLTGFFCRLKEYIDNDGIVFGGSAGAIILGKDIKSCNCDDENDVGLIDTKGLNVLSDFSLLCHYTNRTESKNEFNKQYLIQLSNEMRIIALPEEDTIFVNENGIEILGDKPYYIFDNEQITIIG